MSTVSQEEKMRLNAEARRKAKAAAQDKSLTFASAKIDFLAWFEEIIARAEVCDNRYPVKGMPVYRPYGFYMHNSIMQILEQEWDKLGIDRCLFPAPIPYSFLAREADHVKGFEKDCFWVTRTGLTDLGETEKMALRPTSETAMYEMFSLWIRSFRDLPLKIHQTVSVYRYETKGTRPLIRVREIPWNEAHTAHATEGEARQMLADAWKGYMKLIEDDLCFTGLQIRRPFWDQFPGGEHSEVMDTIMPCGRVLQTVGAHYLGQKFAKVFDITYQTADNKNEYAYMTCFGVSCRLLAAALSAHGDDNGLVLPPAIAKHQVVVVPVGVRIKANDTKPNPVLDECRRVVDTLRAAGVRVHLDDSPKAPGEKFYFWDMKGVPLRIEVGPRDLESATVTVVRRDLTGDDKKATVAAGEGLVEAVKATMESYRVDLRDRALTYAKEHTITVLEDDYECSTIASHLNNRCVCKVPFFTNTTAHRAPELQLATFVEPTLPRKMKAEEREAALEAARAAFDALEAPKIAARDAIFATYERAKDIESERLGPLAAEIRGFPLDTEDVPAPGTKCLFTGEPAVCYAYVARCY